MEQPQSPLSADIAALEQKITAAQAKAEQSEAALPIAESKLDQAGVMVRMGEAPPSAETVAEDALEIVKKNARFDRGVVEELIRRRDKLIALEPKVIVLLDQDETLARKQRDALAKLKGAMVGWLDAWDDARAILGERATLADDLERLAI